ncbi:iron-containing alcohol dehydrogenase [Polycladidibacter stylochi]|uniref:iron-containing alcohol dehydrogenase n=1 Tax=Polycladidibacter stylochi TaxID=1807766 RepID=UPI0008351F78|nr:iron-containing alcohol dehydrogenase [Pseudovibrio stylochi]
MLFSFQNPTAIFFGRGQISAITDQIPENARVLLAYGGGSIKKNGVYNQVTKALHKYQWQEFSGIEPNPHYETLLEAIALVKEEKLDYILAVGGGSVVDGCKLIAAACCYEGEPWDIVTRKTPVEKALPLGCILTLPATGSESNGNSVVTKMATREKRAFGSPLVRPQFAVLDPDTMKTLPERQLRNGIVDAFVHICEQYLTYPVEAMVHDGYAETLLKTLIKLANSFDQQDDEWRENLMLAANQALNGFLGAGVPTDWATHGIGHEITAYYGTDHAATLSIVQPSLLRAQLKQKRGKLRQMGRNVFGLHENPFLAEQTIDAIENFYNKLHMPTRLSHIGVGNNEQLKPFLKTIDSRDYLHDMGEHANISQKEIKEILVHAL